MTFGSSVWAHGKDHKHKKVHVSLVLPLYQADSVKQGENVKGRLSGSVAQLAEYSHGKREALALSPGGVTI